MASEENIEVEALVKGEDETVEVAALVKKEEETTEAEPPATEEPATKEEEETTAKEEPAKEETTTEDATKKDEPTKEDTTKEETAKDDDENMKEAPLEKDEDDMEPMKVEIPSTGNKNTWDDWMDWMSGGHSILPAKYQLVTDENARYYSLLSLQISISVASINSKLLNPNYPIMVSPGQHPDSFPNTEPFAFNSATYFIPMCTLMGVAIASIFLGQISDKMGRKPVLLVLSIVSTFGSLVKYFCRHQFWAFCIAQFVFGFFLANVPVGMAYIGDIFTNKQEKENQLGVLVGCSVLGSSGGGVIAILMESTGLFAPLLVGSALSAIASIMMSWYLIEPGDARLLDTKKEIDFDDDDEDLKRPEEINQVTMWNVVAGALLDNIGSTGLFPLCLSPLAMEQYHLQFKEADQTPVMTLTGYKWLSVCVALMVIPSTFMTPHIFARIGVAATCVMGNVMTAALTMALLFIGTGPATETYFYIFVAVLYGGFPFTVFSQLTTGPMLDVLAPEDKIGYVQGLNNMAMSFGMAFAPWLLGLLADATTTETAIWTGIGISLLAALTNSPLMLRPEMGRPIIKPPAYKRILEGEDEDIVEKLLAGEYVKPELIFEVNRDRMMNHKPFVVPKVKPYSEDKDNLDDLTQKAGEMFLFRKNMRDRVLQELATQGTNSAKVQEFCELINLAHGKLEDEDKQEATNDLGQWIGDYLLDNGYFPHTNPVLIKLMVLTAFPTISRELEVTPDNLEEHALRTRQIMSQYLSATDRQKNKYSLKGVLSTQPIQGFY